MDDNPHHVEVRARSGAFDPQPILFTCVICGEEIRRPWDWRLPLRGNPQEREPVCKSCAWRWGGKFSGPVFNRQNVHTLHQLNAMINTLEWEIRNGKHRHR
jgi:hypothetical protein